MKIESVICLTIGKQYWLRPQSGRQFQGQETCEPGRSEDCKPPEKKLFEAKISDIVRLESDRHQNNDPCRGIVELARRIDETHLMNTICMFSILYVFDIILENKECLQENRIQSEETLWFLNIYRNSYIAYRNCCPTCNCWAKVALLSNSFMKRPLPRIFKRTISIRCVLSTQKEDSRTLWLSRQDTPDKCTTYVYI